MLTNEERLNLEDQLSRVQAQLDAEATSRTGLKRKNEEAQKDEAFFRKKFDYVHAIILRYEQEIEALSGDYIAQPFGEQDVESQANETGRLYQGLVSTEPKRIPEMYGEGLSTTKAPFYETKDIATCLHLIDTLLNGETPNTPTGTTLQLPYTAGSATFVSNGLITPNNWYLLGGVTLVYVGNVVYSPAISGGGSCSLPAFTTEPDCLLGGGVWSVTPPVAEFWTATITARYFLPGFDNNVAKDMGISNFTGYSNSERTSKIATSTEQSMFDTFTNLLRDKINKVIETLKIEIQALNKNEDPGLNLVHKSITEGFHTYLVEYVLLLPLGDGPNGIDGLKSYLETRQAWVPVRVDTCKTAKALFYNERIAHTVTRCDIQSGTLTRIKFLATLGNMYPETGNPSLLNKRDAIKKVLNEPTI